MPNTVFQGLIRVGCPLISRCFASKQGSVAEACSLLPAFCCKGGCTRIAAGRATKKWAESKAATAYYRLRLPFITPLFIVLQALDPATLCLHCRGGSKCKEFQSSLRDRGPVPVWLRPALARVFSEDRLETHALLSRQKGLHPCTLASHLVDFLNFPSASLFLSVNARPSSALSNHICPFQRLPPCPTSP